MAAPYDTQYAEFPDYSGDVILLTGAGASSMFGLATLDTLLTRALGETKTPETNELINDTHKLVQSEPKRGAVFEELITQLRSYYEAARNLRMDWVLAKHIKSLPTSVHTGEAERGFKDALTQCYRILLSSYGPQSIRLEEKQLKIVGKILRKLAELNGGSLHIYTTNYDCSYQVLSSKLSSPTFVTHIDSRDSGSFSDRWCFTVEDVKNGKHKDSQLVYLHRLHGCVAWISIPESPKIIREVYGAGEHLEINDDERLHAMCIKLVTAEEIGKNRAFYLAFREFSQHLRFAKALIVWGQSFRDLEVLRAINAAFDSNSKLKIYYLNPFLREGEALENIQHTLETVPVELDQRFRPRRIPWSTSDGLDDLAKSIVRTARNLLK